VLSISAQATSSVANSSTLGEFLMLKKPRRVHDDDDQIHDAMAVIIRYVENNNVFSNL
jgi:hypothetical protein